MSRKNLQLGQHAEKAKQKWKAEKAERKAAAKMEKMGQDLEKMRQDQETRIKLQQLERENARLRDEKEKQAADFREGQANFEKEQAEKTKAALKFQRMELEIERLKEEKANLEPKRAQVKEEVREEKADRGSSGREVGPRLGTAAELQEILRPLRRSAIRDLRAQLAEFQAKYDSASARLQGETARPFQSLEERAADLATQVIGGALMRQANSVIRRVEDFFDGLEEDIIKGKSSGTTTALSNYVNSRLVDMNNAWVEFKEQHEEDWYKERDLMIDQYAITAGTRLELEQAPAQRQIEAPPQQYQSSAGLTYPLPQSCQIGTGQQQQPQPPQQLTINVAINSFPSPQGYYSPQSNVGPWQFQDFPPMQGLPSGQRQITEDEDDSGREEEDNDLPDS